MLVPNAILKKFYGDSNDSNPLYGPANQDNPANPSVPAAPLPSLSPQNPQNTAPSSSPDLASLSPSPQTSGAALLYGRSPNVTSTPGQPSGADASAAPLRGSIYNSVNAASPGSSSPSAPGGATGSAPRSPLLSQDQFTQQNPDASKAYLPARPVSPFDDNTPHPKLRHALAALFAGMAEYGRPGEGAEMVNRWNQQYQNEANYDANLPRLKAQATLDAYRNYLQQGGEQAGIEHTQAETGNLRANVPLLQHQQQFLDKVRKLKEDGNYGSDEELFNAVLPESQTVPGLTRQMIVDQINNAKVLGAKFSVQADKGGRPEFIQTRTGQKIYPDTAGKFTDPEMQKQWDSEMATHQQSLSEDPTKAAQQDWLAKHPGKGPADYEEYMKKIVPGYKFSLESGAASGTAALNPRQAATRDAILEGRQTPPSGFALSTPYWQTVMGGVYESDPQFNEQRSELRKDLTVGKHSGEINATNTALGHVGVLGDAIDALNNKNGLQVLNGLAQKLGVQTGSDSTTVFNTIVHRVGPELAKAYIGAGGSAGERGSDEKDFDPSLGPQQLKSNVGITAKLLRSKIGALENQWNQNKSDTMPEFQDRFLTPEAKQQLNKWAPQEGQSGPAAGMVRFQDSQGGMHDIPKANLDKARQRDPGLKVIQ